MTKEEKVLWFKASIYRYRIMQFFYKLLFKYPIEIPLNYLIYFILLLKFKTTRRVNGASK